MSRGRPSKSEQGEAALVALHPTAARLLELRPDLSLTETDDWLRERCEGLRRSEMQSAVLVALAKDRFFAGIYGDWLAWAMQATGLAKRMCDTYARTGAFLAGFVHRWPVLAACGLGKLEELARLPASEVGVGMLELYLLKHPRPDTQTREEIRGLVKIYLANELAGREQREGDDAEGEDAGKRAAKPTGPWAEWQAAQAHLHRMVAGLAMAPLTMSTLQREDVRETLSLMLESLDEIAELAKEAAAEAAPEDEAEADDAPLPPALRMVGA